MTGNARNSSSGFTHRIVRDKRGAVSVLFAAAAVPLLAIVGLAVDYGIWNQVNASLQLAADSAALNAAKVAGNGEANNDPDYLREGYVAGQLWFQSAGGYVGQAAIAQPTVTVSGTSTITATVTYTGTVNSLLGNFLYKIAGYPINGTATAIVQTAPFLNIEILIDNSPSMTIGTTISDIKTLTTISPCDMSNMWYNTGTKANPSYTSPSQQHYGNYQCSVPGGAGGGVYNSAATGLACPFPFPNQNLNTKWSGTTATGTNVSTLPYIASDPAVGGAVFLASMFDTGATFNPSNMGPFTCQGWPGVAAQAVDGKYPYPGSPCAFACHSDGTKPAGSGNDMLAMARKSPLKPVLRFDSVKIATNTIISNIQTDNLSFNNLNVGVFTFSSPTNLDNTGIVNEVYPENCNTNGVNPVSCEAGGNFALALKDVGLPPVYPATADTGIQPAVAGQSNNDDTDFPDAMTTLSNNYLPSASGTGLTAASPKKVLFIITDGLEDYPLGYEPERGSMDQNYCNLFKNKGYTVYVIYTPYYPLADDFYLTYLIPSVEGSLTTPGSLAYNLQACASAPSDYISATSTAQLQTALTNFLKAALTTPVRYTN